MNNKKDAHRGGVRRVNDTRCSQAVTRPSTDRALRRFTSVIGREPVLSTWYDRCTSDVASRRVASVGLWDGRARARRVRRPCARRGRRRRGRGPAASRRRSHARFGRGERERNTEKR